MKKVLILLILSLLTADYAFAQTYVGQGNLKIGLKVTQGTQLFSIEDLCERFDPQSQVPVNLEVPPRSSLGFLTDSLQSQEVSLFINGKKSEYLVSEKSNGFSRSASAGSQHQYTFVDESNQDTLQINWTVAYAPIELLDLCPAEKFTECISFQMKNAFSPYPDNSRYDWASKGYISQVNERGIPLKPRFPRDQNGFYFLVNNISEKTIIEMKGFHKEPQRLNEEDSYAQFLYEDLVPGDYELIVKPFEGAPKTLWLEYAFRIDSKP